MPSLGDPFGFVAFLASDRIDRVWEFLAKSCLMIQHQIKRRRLASTGVDFVRGPGKDDFGEVLGAQTHCGLPRPPRG